MKNYNENVRFTEDDVFVLCSETAVDLSVSSTTYIHLIKRQGR